MIETGEPGANAAATISRFSASGQDRLRRPHPEPVVPITEFVDTSRCPNRQESHHVPISPKLSGPTYGGPRRSLRERRLEGKQKAPHDGLVRGFSFGVMAGLCVRFL